MKGDKEKEKSYHVLNGIERCNFHLSISCPQKNHRINLPLLDYFPAKNNTRTFFPGSFLSFIWSPLQEIFSRVIKNEIFTLCRQEASLSTFHTTTLDSDFTNVDKIKSLI